jgi:hypothetical protein
MFLESVKPSRLKNANEKSFHRFQARLEAASSVDACGQASTAWSLAMQKTYELKLSALDVGQLLDALDTRAECYEKTALYLDSGEMDEPFIIEEVTDSDEARGIARHFRDVQAEIERQIKMT